MIFKDILDVRILCEVAARKSFSVASRALSQPAATISSRVTRMEKRAGVPFFLRTTRSVSLTEAGRLAMWHGQRLLEEADAVRSSLDTLRDRPAGRVRVAWPLLLAEFLPFGVVVQQFLDNNPECHASIELTDREVDLVGEQFDLALSVGLPRNQALEVNRLGAVDSGLFARGANGASEVAQLPSTPEELSEFSIGLLEASDFDDALSLINADGKKITVPTCVRLRSNSSEVLRCVVRSGESWIVALPRLMAEPDVIAGRLASVLPDWTVQRFDVYAVTLSRQPIRPAVRAFLELASVHLEVLSGRQP